MLGITADQLRSVDMTLEVYVFSEQLLAHHCLCVHLIFVWLFVSDSTPDYKLHEGKDHISMFALFPQYIISLA